MLSLKLNSSMTVQRHLNWWKGTATTTIWMRLGKLSLRSFTWFLIIKRLTLAQALFKKPLLWDFIASCWHLNKDDHNRQANVDWDGGSQTLNPIQRTSGKQWVLRARESLPQGRTYQLVIQYQTVSHESIYLTAALCRLSKLYLYF